MINSTRRQFLRASGVAVCLPFLESLPVVRAQAPVSVRRRMVAINVGLGLHAPHLIPKQEWRYGKEVRIVWRADNGKLKVGADVIAAGKAAWAQSIQTAMVGSNSKRRAAFSSPQLVQNPNS